jgi:hypothetical protein
MLLPSLMMLAPGQDLISLRVKTSGENELTFEVKNKHLDKVIDVRRAGAKLVPVAFKNLTIKLHAVSDLNVLDIDIPCAGMKSAICDSLPNSTKCEPVSDATELGILELGILGVDVTLLDVQEENGLENCK